MFIKVTNADIERCGDPVVININSIVSVYEDHVEGGSLMTVIYSSNGLMWHVEESLETVYRLLEEASKKTR